VNRAGAKDDMDSAPVALDSRTQEGQDYIAAMKLAGRYAYAGRDWVCERVVKILGARVLDSVHNHHNFAWRETHGGTDLWVVRKGATPAFPGQRGFVGGTMGETSVILEGVENEQASLSLYSTIHGAGRVRGRMEAKGKRDKSGEWTRQPKVTQEMMDKWVHQAHVELHAIEPNSNGLYPLPSAPIPTDGVGTTRHWRPLTARGARRPPGKRFTGRCGAEESAQRAPGRGCVVRHPALASPAGRAW
jgi:hypothetical protein